jgi:hypothetical protein
MLLIFFAVAFGLEQALPADEAIIRAPVALLIIFSAFFFIAFALLQECQRPRILANSCIYWKNLGYSLATFLLYAIFCNSYGSMKSLIPVFNPFSLDPLLQYIDILLHGGTAPSLWFADTLNADSVALLNTLYLVIWGSAMMCYCIWQISSPPSSARSHYISCFFLLWIIAGLILATWLSSVGPIYYSLFYDDAYSAMNADFVSRLYANDSNSTYFLDARNLLLQYAHDDKLVNINGISAMPSLHNAMSMLIALHSYRHHRRLAWFTIPFAALIFLCSFVLGWHYAIDAYVSALCLAIIWWATQKELNHYFKKLKPTHLTNHLPLSRRDWLHR